MINVTYRGNSRVEPSKSMLDWKGKLSYFLHLDQYAQGESSSEALSRVSFVGCCQESLDWMKRGRCFGGIREAGGSEVWSLVFELPSDSRVLSAVPLCKVCCS